MYKKIDFYLSALERHFSSPHSEAKLSVLYQYTYLASRAKETEEHHQSYMAYVTKVHDIQKQIPIELLKEQQHKLKSEGKYMPLIPKAYFANHVLKATYEKGTETGFGELTDAENAAVLRFALNDLHENFDHSIYAKEDFDKQFMIDITYIAYEWFLYTGKFKKNQHRSYQELQDNPYGPYLPYYRMPAPLKATDSDKLEMTKPIEVLSSTKMMQQFSTPCDKDRLQGEVKKDDEISDDEFEPLEKKSTDKPINQTEIFLHEMMDNQKMTVLSAWMQRANLGHYVDHRFLGNKVLLLAHSKGAVIFFPPEVFHRFDIEIPIKHLSLPGQENKVTLESYGYYSYTGQSHIDAIYQFADENFLGEPHRDLIRNIRFSHASFIEYPNDVRGSRMPMEFKGEIEIAKKYVEKLSYSSALIIPAPEFKVFYADAFIADLKNHQICTPLISRAQEELKLKSQIIDFLMMLKDDTIENKTFYEVMLLSEIIKFRVAIQRVSLSETLREKSDFQYDVPEFDPIGSSSSVMNNKVIRSCGKDVPISFMYGSKEIFEKCTSKSKVEEERHDTTNAL